jgi:hypothetical protein
VQLRWKYYYASGATGPRAQLRVDDIRVSAAGPAPVFAGIEPLADGSVRFQVRGVPDRQYAIESSTNLASWETSRMITADTGGFFEFVEPNAGAIGGRFLRARAP